MLRVQDFARSRLRRLSSASLLALVFGACGEPTENPNYQTPIAPVTAGDAQVAIDAGTAPPAVGNDSGAIAPLKPADAAVLDAAAPGLDAQIQGDSQVPPGDAGWLADGALGEGGLTADAGPPRADLGKGTGKDVITIGDSWMLLLFTGIQESLVKASGNQPYRKYGVPGTRMLSGEIPGQYADAKRADPVIKTVVMTGGGNDIIQNAAIEQECTTGGPMCTMQLEKIGKSLSDLWAQMSKDGVQDVIHVMYSSSAGNPIKDREANNKMLADSCAAVPPPLRCHLLNTDMIIMKSDMRSDNIHPNDAGYDKIGKAVFDLMVKEGMRR
jgi:GDSL-like Lipase/Acylhydrolase family